MEKQQKLFIKLHKVVPKQENRVLKHYFFTPEGMIQEIVIVRKRIRLD